MLVDSEPHDECNHSLKLGHGWQCAKQRGRVKWASTPMSRGMTMPVHLSDMEYSHQPEEGPFTTHGGVASYPPLKMKKNKG